MGADGLLHWGQSAARIVASALAGVMTIEGCGGPAPTSVIGATASAIRDGITITLSIDRDSLETGQQLRARVRVRNHTAEPILWWGGSCRLDGTLVVEPDAQVEPDHGLAWAGDAGRLKARLVSGSTVLLPPDASIDLDGLADRGDPSSCRFDRGFNVLGPGEELASEAAWRAVDLIGAPLPPGSYVVRASFPRLGPEIALDPALIDRARDLAPVVVEMPFSLAGSGPEMTAGQAVDRLLANPGTDRWLAVNPERTWLATTLRWDGGRWLVELRTTSGSDARVSVDGRSGSVEALAFDR
jgi:hypothetical protein